MELPFVNADKSPDNDGYVLEQSKLAEIEQQLRVINAKIGADFFGADMTTIEMVLLLYFGESDAVLKIMQDFYPWYFEDDKI